MPRRQEKVVIRFANKPNVQKIMEAYCRVFMKKCGYDPDSVKVSVRERTPEEKDYPYMFTPDTFQRFGFEVPDWKQSGGDNKEAET